MIIPMLCVTIFVILVVWFLLPRVARLMIHTPTAISIFVCLRMVQLMAVFISMRCTLCGHFLQVALTLILVFVYSIAASYLAFNSFPTRRSSDLLHGVHELPARAGTVAVGASVQRGGGILQIGRAHVLTPVTVAPRMPSSA